ncbi:MAG: adenylyltransferase [Syntrophobacterales bacterium CG_4_8_14_3_um_filter_58_8]|nr:MAG: adenylyltransferase [Syntrophaceae bacterium CG2_30_58_14]PIV06524.1 MAG: adenylyltransferase [Syntrophobacterales bacterium CG03_land_8_20_14_0_80_58_14]PJC71739.1 MAG: adenylyltransferase [Syntrophobacterales bacterium CG_4_8_14_3_um_filter_58_8]
MPEIHGCLTDIEQELYSRNIRIPEVGVEGQLKLLNSRVLIIGLGGLGSSALYYLAACGVGEIGIVDEDRVELSNLQRQILHGRKDVGRKKTVSAGRSITRLRPNLHLIPYSCRISEANAQEIIAPYDFVIEATDNFASKFLINDVCVRLGKAFSHAGILGMYGQTMTIVPGKGPCYRCVFGDPPPPGAVPTTREAGVLGVVPGVLGAIQAAEAIKYLLNCGCLLVGRLLTWDALAMHFRETPLPEDMRCGICRTGADLQPSRNNGKEIGK